MALAAGSRLGVYDITAQIGEGGMGQVFQATDTKLKRQVAVKILPPSVAADPDRLARFQREAEVLASLNHPNIAHIYGLDRQEGPEAREGNALSFIVMELVEGDDLSGTYDFSVSPAGVLAYVPGGNNAAGLSRQMVWVDRQGHEQPINAPSRAYGVIRLSPDETRAVVDIRSGQSDIFIWNFARETLTPLTFEHGDDNPIWTPDGRRVVWVSRRDGAANLYWQAADGTGSAERLTTSALGQNPKAITPDGSRIVFTQQNSRTSANDLHLLIIASRATQPLLETAVTKNDPSISLDGRWVAFESRESGESEVYVRPFPKVDAGRWQVSTGGGRQPQWARNGRELFFLDGAGFLTSARVDTQATFAFDAPRKILETRYAGGNGPWTYDVSKDGQRFLMLKDTRANDATLPASSSIVVMLNALEEAKRRLNSTSAR